jgi:hypothetical protein
MATTTWTRRSIATRKSRTHNRPTQLPRDTREKKRKKKKKKRKKNHFFFSRVGTRRLGGTAPRSRATRAPTRRDARAESGETHTWLSMQSLLLFSRKHRIA